jgi:uncharacterized RDD family membrane protein YckC
MENDYQPQDPSEHLLDEHDYIDLQRAASGRRLVNYLVDYTIIYVVWRFVFFKSVVSFLTVIYEHTQSQAALYTFSYILILGWSLLYKTAFETLTGGKTIGKYLTGTRAVNEDGTRLSSKTALLRALSRIVPFEAFSALGSPCYPWHDRWTHTYVIDEKASTLNY